MQLTNEEIKILRDVRIHRILGIEDDGRRISRRCPFHNERSPSFFLYADNSFHCFGCGANGAGAIDFCEKLGFSFLEAAEELCKYV